jgi:rod shape-determining protein MreD
MRGLSFLLALAVAAGLHLAGLVLIPGFPRLVDLVLIVVVLFARDGRVSTATLGGSAAGLVADALAGGPFGLHGFADTLVGYTAARVAQQLVVQRSSGVILVFTLASALQQALLAALAVLLLPAAELPAAPWMIAKAACTGIVGLLLAQSERLIAGRVATRRAERRTGLRG